MLVGDEVLVLTRWSTVKVRNVAANPRASAAEHTWSCGRRWRGLLPLPTILRSWPSRAAYLARFGTVETWGTACW